MAASRKPKSEPSWIDIKAKLSDFDRDGLLGLVQDLYAAGKENRDFLHARFGLGDDVLKSYKLTIDRWLWPDVFKNQDISISKAKKAIADYKKAVGQPEGMAELMVFYCERAAGFSTDVGVPNEGYVDALVRMFEQALEMTCVEMTCGLPGEQRESLLDRLDTVRDICHDFGYGVGDYLNDLLAEYGVDD